MTQRFLLITTILFYSHLAISEVKPRNFQTTRLMQSGGAGVGSLLLNEATVLNPATSAFFTTSTIYYQKDKVELNDKESDRGYNFDDGMNEFVNITDTSAALKGAFSYLYQNEEFGKRKWLALSGASPLTKTSSLGITYRYIDEESNIRDEKFSQVVVGLIINQSENLTIGFTYVDPTIVESHYSSLYCWNSLQF